MGKRIGALAVAVFLLFFSTPSIAEEKVKIRIGWQIPWSIQGQIVQIWKHTDILAKRGISAEFIGRTYGPELNEIALAGAADVILTADQPAAALFSKKKGWVGIGRLMYNRTSTYVPPGSPIKSVSDLKGKTLGVPIGAAAERIIKEDLRRAGLDPDKDLKIINVGIREQGPLVLDGKNSTQWGNIDALSGFDPAPAIFESRGLVRMIHSGKVVSLVLMNENFIAKNPGAPGKLLEALKDAYEFYARQPETANQWFMQESKLKDANSEACNIAAASEPNLKAKNRSDIRVWFTEEDFTLMQKGADFIAPAIKERINMRDFVTNRYAK